MTSILSSILTGAALCLALLVAPPCRAALQGEPVFAGTWSAKDSGGTGALFHDMDWDALVANWTSRGADGQYLADVAVYRRGGQWKFAAVWRVGAGHGALLLATQDKFLETWRDLRETQELIDLEVVVDGGVPKYLGVWRRKPAASAAAGALFLDMDWDTLVERHRSLGGPQHLVGVAPFVIAGKRRYAGVWRVGDGHGGLFVYHDWPAFLAQKKKLDATQELIDFEMFQSDEGDWRFLGVWRAVAGRAGPVDASASPDVFRPLSSAQLVGRWTARRDTATLTGLAVVNPITALRGDTTCAPGDDRCNHCANGVADQFRLAFEGGHRPMVGWDHAAWGFRGNDRHPPDGARPEVSFNAGPTNHIQGLVRTRSSRFPLAGSHSHRDQGSIFVVESRGGQLELHSIYRSTIDHPSGVAVLGDGLFVSEKGRLRVIRISDSGKPQTLSSPLEKLGSAGGGLGLARLHDGSTLLVVSGAGAGFRKGTTKGQRDENLEPRQTRFFQLADPFARLPDGLKPFGEWSHPVESRPDRPMAYSENLSLVTECGTGRLYTIHTTGDYGLGGDGWWRLSRIDDGPRLTHVDIARQDQRHERCHHRSAATVHVDANGMLEFICTERRVVKWHPMGKFDFTWGHR
ncbi:hypothetical protein [Ideonella sp. A 288]|uniref:hypothetical protein n=1 Tax=Ideonella sp. A 288 TaxID=1962181 RepID=UPI000B4ADE7F|nr:hypothetical protein [Ideonella sp. A 288]